MKKGIYKRTAGYMGRDKKLALFIIISILLSNISALTIPMLIGKAIDLLPDAGNLWDKFLKYIIIIIVLYAVASLLNWLALILTNKTAVFVSQSLRADVFKKLSRLPLKFYDNTSDGEIMSRMINDIEQIDDGLSQAIYQLLTGITAIVITLGFMLYLNIYVAVVAVLITPLCYITGYFITRYGKKRFKAQADILGELDGYIDEIIKSQHTVKAFSYEANSMKKFKEMNDRLYDEGWQAQFASALVNPTTRFINNSAYVLVGIVCIIAVLNGSLSPGGIAAFLSYTIQFSKPINELSSITMHVQLATASLRRIFDFMDEPEEIPDKISGTGERFDGQIKFDKVDFSYIKGRKIIDDFNLDINSNIKVAIVGSTGSGKTTLVNLLMRFYEIDNGAITIDGINIKDMSRRNLRGNIGMVLQETWLFNGTVYDNISYGNPDATREEIISASKLSNAHNFIKKLEKGYDTVIESNGSNLSAGQRQLITIARVMLLDTPVVILDEATSNVDILTEQKIQEAFNQLTKNKTSLVIAHRLSTIKDSDLILFLEKGRVIEKGSHSQLMELKGAYFNLYKSFDK